MNSLDFSGKKLVEARQAEYVAYEQMRQNAEENRRITERLYQNLALVSGGTLALSVTFLGYLINGHRQVCVRWVLELSWVALMLCVISSLGYIFSHGRYTFFALEAEHREAQKKMLEVETTEFENLRYGTLRTRTEREQYRMRLDKVLRSSLPGLKETAKLSRRYLRLSKWYEHVANTSFVLGLLLLLGFAIVNA